MNHAKIGTLAIEIGINVQIQQMFFVWGARATFPHYDRVNRYTIVTTIYDEAFIEPDRISECYFSCYPCTGVKTMLLATPVLE